MVKLLFLAATLMSASAFATGILCEDGDHRYVFKTQGMKGELEQDGRKVADLELLKTEHPNFKGPIYLETPAKPTDEYKVMVHAEEKVQVEDKKYTHAGVFQTQKGTDVLVDTLKTCKPL
ncbi:MAG: hypothetical protein C5B49_03740 [Bdellovibrio sp.]|nr:MAG: hypothetical protein C5B49_03740 [Bdellovibrio sp.]